MPKSDPAERYMVLGRIVTPATNEIALGNEVARIEPKSMEVLVHLLEHAGEVATRDALQDAIWGDVVVGDDSLTNAIIKLRKAFGDDARNPRLIETIPKRGYRLIAPVSHEPRARTVNRLPYGRLLAAVALIAIVAVGWAVWAAKDRQDPALPNVAAQDGRLRVAVAPFQNLSGDPAQDYLAQGIEQTILAGLAGFPQIAAMHADDHSAEDYRLEGSVHREGDAILIDTRLLEAETGIVLTTQRYERGFSDLLAIQTEIEAEIVTALALEIDLASRTAQSRGLTDSIEAYDLFLRAREALLLRDKAGNSRAQDLYERAIARDPKFARAYGGLALTHAAEFRNGWTDNGPEALDQAFAMAETALSIQPNLPEQYWVVGYVETQRRNLSAAVTVLNDALRLDPGYADAFALLGGVHTYSGHPRKTLPLLREAMRLRPDAGYLYFLLLGRAYYFLDDCDQAMINLNEAAKRNPSYVETHIYIAGCLVRQGDVAGAEWEAEEIVGLQPGFTAAAFFETYPMTSHTQISVLSADLKRAGIE